MLVKLLYVHLHDRCLPAWRFDENEKQHTNKVEHLNVPNR